MINNNELAPISNSDFLSKIPSDDFSALAKEGMMLYSTDKSLHFNPLILWKEEDNIMVTPQDSIHEDKLIALFSEEDVSPGATYAFPEAELVALISEEPERIADIVAFLDENQEVGSNELMMLLTALKNEGFSVIHILVTLASIHPDELERLIFVFNEMPTFLRQFFIELLCNQTNPEDEED